MDSRDHDLTGSANFRLNWHSRTVGCSHCDVPVAGLVGRNQAPTAADNLVMSPGPRTFDHHRLDAFCVARDALRLGDALARRMPRGYATLQDQLRRAVVGIPGHRRGIQPNGRRQDLTVPHRQRRSVRGGSRLGGGCNPGTCSRYRDRSGDVSARPAVRDAHSARRHAPPPTLMTAAAVVVVLVCEPVFEFVSVCGERVRPAGLGSRDLRAPRAAWPLNARPTRTRTRTRARTRPRARVPPSIPRFAHRRKFSTGFSGWL